MKKVIIFGANRTGQEFYQAIQRDYTVLGIIDRNINQFSEKFIDVSLYTSIDDVTPEVLSTIDQIIIASSSLDQIKSIKETLLLSLMNSQHVHVTSIYDTAILEQYLNDIDRDLRVVIWKELEGDIIQRLTYPELDTDSIVFDLGGYKGQWASDIFSKYGSNIFVFEPVQSFSNFIEERFSKNNKIKVYNIALGKHDGEEKFLLKKDESKSYNVETVMESDDFITVKFKDIISFLAENQISTIQLMKINIEGGEYELLDYLIEKDWIQHIDNIQIQFHDFFPNSEQRMSIIQSKLAETHTLTYNYKYVWENWKRKGEVLS